MANECIVSLWCAARAADSDKNEQSQISTLAFVTSLSMSMQIRFCDDYSLIGQFLKVFKTFMRLNHQNWEECH